jgi:serine/threonine-protein kinase
MADQAGTVAGRRLGGRYRVGALLAAGGMGEVWAARDLLLDRAVAVKMLGGALAGDGRAAERLRREARAAGRVEHPNIARVLDLGEQDGRPYLVMELLEGESLAARLDRAGAMGPVEAVRVVAAAAGALEAAHRAGVVHRDVKPGNVFLTSDGEVKVLDFGIASAAGEATLTTGDLLGTAAYLAPERVLGHQATPAADIYSLGVVLYELLAGRRPFEATSDIALAMAHVNAEAPPLSRFAPSIPPALVAACTHAMAKDPSARPPSAAAFALLLRVAGPAAVPAQDRRVRGRPGPTQPLPPAAATRPLAAAGAGLPPRAGRRRCRARPRRRGLVMALLLVGAVLVALPVLAGGLPGWGGEGVDPPFAVVDPGVDVPDTRAPEPSGTDAATDPGPTPTGGAGDPGDAGEAGQVGEANPPAADDQPDPGDGRDQDGDSGGSGRSGGGDPGRGGSSGPG